MMMMMMMMKGKYAASVMTNSPRIQERLTLFTELRQTKSKMAALESILSSTPKFGVNTSRKPQKCDESRAYWLHLSMHAFSSEF